MPARYIVKTRISQTNRQETCLYLFPFTTQIALGCLGALGHTPGPTFQNMEDQKHPFDKPLSPNLKRLRLVNAQKKVPEEESLFTVKNDKTW